MLLVILLAVAGCGRSSAPGPSLVAFHAKWCSACQEDRPLLDEVAQEFPVTEIDFETQRSISSRYHVCYLPTYVVLFDGAEVMRTMNLSTAIRALRTSDR